MFCVWGDLCLFKKNDNYRLDIFLLNYGRTETVGKGDCDLWIEQYCG